MTPPDPAAIRAAILARLATLRPGTTCCPSEVARALAADWRPLMPAIRDAADTLAETGALRVTQGGTPVRAATARGPIRLGRPRPMA